MCAMRVTGVFRRLSAMGAAGQASVPGVYAWGVTVVPAAWSRDGSPVSKVAAVVALVALLGGVVAERLAPGRARLLSLWGFVLACALSWSAARDALGPMQIDALRGAAGMIGWALFAFASAAPALQRRDDVPPMLEGQSVASRRSRVRGDAAYLVAGVVMAALLQLVGWRVTGVERALLVRFVT
ncbi:MAG: hypothetical protein ACRELB_17840, partial [Polyangiaceae bacterium]